MTDDEPSSVEASLVEAEVASALRAAAGQVRVVDAQIPVRAIRRRAARRRRAQRRAAVGVALVAVCGVAVGLGLDHSLSHRAAGERVIIGDSPTPSASIAAPTVGAPTTAAPTTASVPVVGVPTTPAPTTTVPATAPPAGPVPGYTAAQAAAVVQACEADMTSLGFADPGPAVLRDAVTDADGTTAVFTTASGWAQCNLLPDGAVDGPPDFRTFASGDDWGLPPTSGSDPDDAVAPTDAPDYWLTSDVDQLFAGGGVLDYQAVKNEGQPVSSFANLVIGRAAPSVVSVAVTMPTGAVDKVPVVNGIFLAREITPSAPGPGPSGITGYDATGQVVYQSPTAGQAGSPPAPACWVDPSGQAVTPPISGTACIAAVAWG